MLAKKIHKRSQNSMFVPFTRFYFLSIQESCVWTIFGVFGVENMGDKMNKMTEQKTGNVDGLTPEQAEAVFANFLAGIQDLNSQHAVEMACNTIELIQREFGIDLTTHSPNAKSYLIDFYRRWNNQMLVKATEKLVGKSIQI